MSRSAARWGIVIAIVLATVVVPFFFWGDALAGWIDDYVRGEHPRGEVAAVLGGLLAADVVLPIPSSVTMVGAGIALGIAGGTATSFVGMTVGCVVGYELGLRLGRPGVRRLVEAEQLDRVQAFVRRYGDAIIVGLRPVPILAEASTIFAGLSGMPRVRFGVLCGAGEPRHRRGVRVDRGPGRADRALRAGSAGRVGHSRHRDPGRPGEDAG